MMRNDVWLYIADIVYCVAHMFFGTYGEYVPLPERTLQKVNF